MGIKPLDRLGELQRTVLEVLWTLDEAGVQEILDELAPARPLAYTTILTTLQNLERAGWVKHRRVGRAYAYRATRERAKAGATSLRSFIARTFGGSAGLLVQTLLEEERLTPKELARLRALIESKQEETKR